MLKILMKKRLLSALLCMFMVMILMPTVTFAAPTSYNLWVGGVEVTRDNASSITGAGITGTVTYDDDTKTLTLKNASITGVHSFTNGVGTDSAGIYVSQNFGSDLTINLVGENTITGKLTGSDISSYGIYSKVFYGKNLNFTGSGKLNVSSANGKSDETNNWSVAIYAYGNIVVGVHCTITAASGEASTKSAGIYGYSLTLNGAKVIAGDSAASATEVNATIPGFRSDSYKYLTIISRAPFSIRVRLIN